MKKMSTELGEKPIGELLLKLSLPATVGMIVNALYNVIDTIFLGQWVSKDAIGGLTIAFPIQIIVMAFAFWIGIGAASIVSRALGAGDTEKANIAAGNAFSSIIVFSTIFVVFSFIFLEPFLRLFGATDTLLPFAKDYITIILIGSVFFSFTMTANNLIRAEGNAKVAMFTMIIGTGLNIILDPIFILVFKMGIKGAAIATILSQFCSFIYILIYMYSGKSTLNVRPHHLKPCFNVLYEIISVGFAAFIRQVAGSVVAAVVNNLLAQYGGDNAINVIGVLNRLAAFLFMPLFGVVHGLQPILGFNYGAGKLDRAKHVIKLSIIVTTIFATVSWLIAELFPSLLFSLFIKGDELEEILIIGIPAIRIIFAVIPVIGIQVICGAIFQALGKPLPSIFLALLRQVIILIPVVQFLPRFMNLGLTGIWLSYPISDLLSTIITIIIFIIFMNNLNKSIINNLETIS